MLRNAAVLLLLSAAPAAAQVLSRPTDPPLVTAANESWYLLREPIQFAGDLYHPAGPIVFFDGNLMVRSGHYNGVPLYTNTTLEPFSVVFVPVRRGLMQPYERLRRGDLAGTSASRTPSFPGTMTPGAATLRQAATAPTAPPLPPGAISVFTPETGAPLETAVPLRPPAPSDQPPDMVDTAGRMMRRHDEPAFVSLLRPESNDGLWIRYAGEKWVSAGPAVPLRTAEFIRVGEYAGFSVFARRGLKEDVIYLPTRAGFIAPYRLKE